MWLDLTADLIETVLRRVLAYWLDQPEMHAFFNIKSNIYMIVRVADLKYGIEMYKVWQDFGIFLIQVDRNCSWIPKMAAPNMAAEQTDFPWKRLFSQTLVCSAESCFHAG